MDIIFHPVGVIRTPFKRYVPYQPVEAEEGTFRLILNREYTKGLQRLSDFRYIYVIYYMDRVDREPDANYGWLDELDDREHLMPHIKGIPHDY